jgi:predicted small lipoprotein YifL
MKTIIALLVVAAVICFVAGCGPGEPFEVKGLHAPQSAATIQVAVAK